MEGGVQMADTLPGGVHLAETFLTPWYVVSGLSSVTETEKPVTCAPTCLLGTQEHMCLKSSCLTNSRDSECPSVASMALRALHLPSALLRTIRLHP